MIFDQPNGVHPSQADYLGMGWVRTWVSGNSVDVASLHGWLEYTVAGRMHYRVEGVPHYTVEGKLHYVAEQED